MATDDRRMRGETLRARYGQPTAVPSKKVGGLLRALGVRDQLHPRDCWACSYPSWEAAEAFAAANREHYGHDVIGPAVVGEDVVCVIDLRKSIRELAKDTTPDWQPTDPALPDEWTPEVHRG